MRVFEPGGLQLLYGGRVVQPQGAATVALSVRGFASQTADLQQWTDSAGVVLARVTAAGLFADQVRLAKLGAPAVDQAQEYLDVTGSSGFFDGGAITDAGGGSVDIAAGSGCIRATPDDNAPLLSFEWPAFLGVAIPSDTVRYVYISYNGGSPTYVLSASEFDEAPDKILIGGVVNEAGSITDVFNVGVRLEESIGQAGRFMRRVLGISRDARRGGLIVGQTGARNVTVSAGHLWWGRTDYTITAKDTSGSSTFARYYRDGGGGWTKEPAQTQWPNTQWDDGDGGLATLAANKWGTLWFYLESDDHLVMVYGQASHNTMAAAEQESPPSTLPPRLASHGTLAARFIFQVNAATATISSAFDTRFTFTGVTDHGDLAGLGDNDHYQFVPVASATESVLRVGPTSIVGGSASGTYVGINAAADYVGDFLNFQTDGVSALIASQVTLAYQGGDILLERLAGGKIEISDYLDQGDIALQPEGSVGQVLIDGVPPADATKALLNLNGSPMAGASASGTMVGCNPGAFAGDFINLQVGDVTKLKVDKDGALFLNTIRALAGGVDILLNGGDLNSDIVLKPLNQVTYQFWDGVSAFQTYWIFGHSGADNALLSSSKHFIFNGGDGWELRGGNGSGYGEALNAISWALWGGAAYTVRVALGQTALALSAGVGLTLGGELNADGGVAGIAGQILTSRGDAATPAWADAPGTILSYM